MSNLGFDPNRMPIIKSNKSINQATKLGLIRDAKRMGINNPELKYVAGKGWGISGTADKTEKLQKFQQMAASRIDSNAKVQPTRFVAVNQPAPAQTTAPVAPTSPTTPQQVPRMPGNVAQPNAPVPQSASVPQGVEAPQTYHAAASAGHNDVGGNEFGLSTVRQSSGYAAQPADPFKPIENKSHEGLSGTALLDQIQKDLDSPKSENQVSEISQQTTRSIEDLVNGTEQ